MQDNLWVSLGFNFTGFEDKDLTTSEYTNRGLYLRLRYKFDEELLATRIAAMKAAPTAQGASK